MKKYQRLIELYDDKNEEWFVYDLERYDVCYEMVKDSRGKK